jgi:hypothetical protein
VPWGGAGVVVTDKSDNPNVTASQSFYTDPRLVITNHVGEISWLFEKLVRIFNQIEGYGAWKEELFGRLANMANRVIQKQETVGASELLRAVLHEAYSVAEEISKGTFQYLAITSGNMIYDDLIEKAESGAFVSLDEAEEFFRLKGLLP